MRANIAVVLTRTTTVCLALLGGCHDSPAPVVYPAPTADEARAIVAAEQFVMRNGYTAAIGDPRHYHRELMESGLPPSLVWQLRHDTLRPRAYGIARQRGPAYPGWTVFFEQTTTRDTLRGVELSPDLSELAMSHYDLRLDAPTKILRPRTPPDASAEEPRSRRTKS